jgi:hypothetical protein
MERSWWVALLTPALRRGPARACWLLPGGPDEPVHTSGKRQDPEVLGRKEVVLSGLVHYPQLPVRLGVAVGPDFVDLTLNEIDVCVFARIDTHSVSAVPDRRCLNLRFIGRGSV